MIEIALLDGSVKSFNEKISVWEIISSINNKLAKEAIAAKINNQIVDLSYVITQNIKLEIITNTMIEALSIIRHSTTHLMAQAVKRLFPDVKLAIGPSIDNGFYYDFDVDINFSPDNLIKIEKEMEKITKENLVIKRFELSKSDALLLMKNEPYKIELINNLSEDDIISFYKQGDFIDLCSGPHLPNTSKIKAFKLISSAGAYWRGNEKNKMLQRIYGTAFNTKAELDDYLKRVEEAKKRDHNKIGRELELFTTSSLIGQGLPLIMPKGAKIIQILQRMVEDEEERRGYLLTKTPFMAKSDMYKVSGHWEHYKEGMFIINEKDETFALRPMTCPFQFMIYKAAQRSYRDLPLRYNETSTLFRNESSGEMHGLIRVRQFTISEAHLICTPEQLEDEFKGVVDLINYFMNILEISNDVTYRFSKWDPNNKEKYINNPLAWEESQVKMKTILDNLKINYVEADGEAAFYGPKLDLQLKNVHGKEDTIITVQVDFALPERFDMTYIDKDNQKKHPIVIHRTSVGCYERLLAMLIEKHAGAFPTWLAPVQIKILPITENHNVYARKISDLLIKNKLRVETDYRLEKIGYKIREAQLEKVPYMLIIGDKEIENNSVAVRKRFIGDQGSITLDNFLAQILEEINVF